MFFPKILTQTAEWIVVNKPPGWLTIPAKTQEPNLVDWFKESQTAVWVVHRIDRETSGIVLFAKTAEAHLRANTWFQERKVKKTYHCLAAGVPSAPIFKINQPIEGSPSITQIEVLERFQNSFLARAFPRSGRRHQIRIHLSKTGYPILGDSIYQGPKQVQIGSEMITISRVALHASVLELPTGEKFEADFPEDFQAWLSELRKLAKNETKK